MLALCWISEVIKQAWILETACHAVTGLTRPPGQDGIHGLILALLVQQLSTKLPSVGDGIQDPPIRCKTLRPVMGTLAHQEIRG